MNSKISSINNDLSYQEIQFLYLHRYLYGGATTFTAHLLHTLQSFRGNSIVLRYTRRSENKLRDFGYGIFYRNISMDILKTLRHPFVTLFKDNYLHILPKLNEGKNPHDIMLVIHDYRDISDKVIPYIKSWKVITIRKTVQEYLKNRYNLDTLFLYHPFYPYPIISRESRKGAVSISRISFEKNTDMIIKANRTLSEQQGIKIYGCPSRMYVHLFLGGLNGDFSRYYCGKFDKSFSTLSEILANAKFVVDLSSLKHDGGGTQYTFLEAIHNGCGLILHRKWLEGKEIPSKYCDFKENYNCFAIENEKELTELIKKDPDPTRIVKNAQKLLKRHIEVDWSEPLRDNYM